MKENLNLYDIVQYIGKDENPGPVTGALAVIDDVNGNGKVKVTWKETPTSKHWKASWFEESEFELVERFQWPVKAGISDTDVKIEDTFECKVLSYNTCRTRYFGSTNISTNTEIYPVTLRSKDKVKLAKYVNSVHSKVNDDYCLNATYRTTVTYKPLPEGYDFLKERKKAAEKIRIIIDAYQKISEDNSSEDGEKPEMNKSIENILFHIENGDELLFHEREFIKNLHISVHQKPFVKNIDE